MPFSAHAFARCQSLFVDIHVGDYSRWGKVDAWERIVMFPHLRRYPEKLFDGPLMDEKYGISSIMIGLYSLAIDPQTPVQIDMKRVARMFIYQGTRSQNGSTRDPIGTLFEVSRGVILRAKDPGPFIHKILESIHWALYASSTQTEYSLPMGKRNTLEDRFGSGPKPLTDRGWIQKVREDPTLVNTAVLLHGLWMAIVQDIARYRDSTSWSWDQRELKDAVQSLASELENLTLETVQTDLKQTGLVEVRDERGIFRAYEGLKKAWLEMKPDVFRALDITEEKKEPEGSPPQAPGWL